MESIDSVFLIPISCISISYVEYVSNWYAFKNDFNYKQEAQNCNSLENEEFVIWIGKHPVPMT